MMTVLAVLKQRKGTFLLVWFTTLSGGSLAAPIITAIVGTSTYFSAERVITGQILASAANLIGIILMIWSIKGVVRRLRPFLAAHQVTK